MFKEATTALRKVLVGFWHWAATWKWWDSLIAIAYLGSLSAHEFAGAEISLVLCAFSLISLIWHKNEKGLFFRCMATLAICSGFGYLSFVTVDEKEDRDWSHLSHFVFHHPGKNIPVCKPFKGSYDKSLVGDATGDCQPAGAASYVVYQRSTIIWLQSLGMHFILHKDNTVREKGDPNPVSTKEFFEEELLLPRFPRTPKEKELHPPIGSIAKFWQDEPTVNWEEEVGYLHWYVDYPGRDYGYEDVCVQRFKLGYVVGIVPEKNPFIPKNDRLQSGLVFTITNDKRALKSDKKLIPPKDPQIWGWDTKPRPESLPSSACTQDSGTR